MKSILLTGGAAVSLLLLFTTCGSLWGQSTPEAFLAMLPSPPPASCTADTSIINKFSREIDKFREAYEAYAERSNKQSEMTTEEQQKIASDQMAKMGISSSELSKLENMSEAEQQKWAEDYAAKMMAQSMTANPSQQRETASLISLNEKKLKIMDEVKSYSRPLEMEMKEIELRDTIESRALKARLQPIISQMREINLGEGSTRADAQRWESLSKQAYNQEVKFCEKMSPMWIDYIVKHLAYVKKIIPMLREAQEIENKIGEIQMNKGDLIKDVNAAGAAAVNGYASLLAESYKYCIGKYEATYR
ncbi:MAG: hypothetical protein PHV12_05675 [Bacteroidales bacterium]|nr:hypothetical protein [Bacteroidales bacterium]MDD4059041.1 hypothetical protein [Bacteroidales bacterium]